MIKFDQIGLKWIQLDQTVENWGWGLAPHPTPVGCLFIFEYWKTWLKLVMLENLQACYRLGQTFLQFFCVFFWFTWRYLKTQKYPFKINYLTFNLPSIYSSLIFSTGSKSSGSSISKDWFSSWTDFSCFCKLVLFKEV